VVVVRCEHSFARVLWLAVVVCGVVSVQRYWGLDQWCSYRVQY
jgi:hypothetical protein